MISNLILLFISGIVSIITAVLPLASSFPIPSEATAWVSYFHTGIQLIGFILPLDTVYTVFMLWLGIQASLFSAWLFMYIYGLFRGHAQ